MKKLLFFLKIVFIICLFTWIALKFDYKTAKNVLAAANIGWAVAAVAFSFISVIFVSLRWKTIIRGFWQEPKTSVAQLYWYNLLAVFYNLFIPTSIAGEAVRIWRLAKNEDNDYAKATFTAIIDRVMGVLTWFVLFLTLPSLLPKNRLLLLVFLVPIALYFFTDKLAYKEKKLIDFSRHHPLDILYAVIFSFACQIVAIISGYAAMKCFNLDIGLFMAAGLLTAGALVSLIPISVLGFGAREGFFITVLPLYGLHPTQAVLLITFFVFLTYANGIAGGLIELMNAGWKISSLKSPDIETMKPGTPL